MGTTLQDLRYAVRTLARQPGFAAVAVLTLAVGIGANTAIYSVVNATLLRPLPYRNPDQLMQVSLTMPSFHGRPPVDDMVWSYPKYEAFRGLQKVFEDAALYRSANFNLTGTGEPEQIRGEIVTAGYFRVLGIAPQVGRVFRPDEDATPERDMVAMLSHHLWTTRFGADPAAIGRTLQLDLKTYLIVGVLPAGFRPLSGAADVWLPIHTLTARTLGGAQSHSYQMVARLRRGVNASQAKAEVARLGARIEEVYPDRRVKGWGAKALTLGEARIDPTIRTAVLVMFGAVGFVLLIAVVNIANLLLARGTARSREIAIRLAVGASRARLVRQLLTESLLLSSAGAIAGLAIAYAGVRALDIINPANGTAFGRRMSGLTVLGLTSIRLDLNALLFTAAVALFTGVVFGLAPALHTSRAGVADHLKSGGAKRSNRALGLFTGRNLLVISEMALAMVLLVGAGLMIKSFGRLMATRIGIDAENVLTVRINLPGATPEAAASAFFQELETRLAALPGVQSAGLGDCFALAGGCSGTSITFPDRPPVTEGTQPSVGVLWISPAYFHTLRIPLLRGRWFTESDRKGSPNVVVINETAARRFWPGEEAIGHLIRVGQGGMDQAEVIGVVGDVRYRQLDELPQPDVYMSYLQSPRWGMLANVRSALSPADLTESIRAQAHSLNRELPLFDIKTMDQRIREATGRARFSVILLAVFAAIALILSAVGIYGVMAYVVTQRTREIGIRMALGARPADVLGLVVGRGGWLALAGIGIGIAGALFATRVLATLLYEVRPYDSATYITIGCGLLAVALLASYIPARRAAMVDPSAALRAE
jgi:putative ABC transport system permease protein